MKTLRSVLVLVLLLGTLTIPGFAQEAEIDSGKTVSGMSAQLWEIVYGREGFSGNAGSSRTSEGVPLHVWRIINSRDGFDFYASAIERPQAIVNGMSAELWDIVTGRDGFDLYARDAVAVARSTVSAAKPDSMPADLWQIISGRGGFDSVDSCAVC